jgi:hypothetical protein
LNRREFITLVGSIAAYPLPFWLLWPSAARGQNPAASQRPAGPANQVAEVGQVATLQGRATVIRGSPATAIPLKISDPIFRNDALSTGADSSLGVTFDDETTFSLSPNTRIVVNEFIYEERGGANAANAALGIRGTTGAVDVPQGGASGVPGEPSHVGEIEVFNRRNGRLGILTQGASAFAIRSGPGGSLRSEPFQIPPQEAARDRGVLQRLFVSHSIGRRITSERLRTRGPGRFGPRNPRQPGRMQQEFNRNPRPGGPLRPPAQRSKGNPGGRQKH